MKQLFIIFTFLFLPAVTKAEENKEIFQIAKAVKLGRGHTYSIYTGATVGKNNLKIDCDVNCNVCNNMTDICSSCTSNRYLSNNLCLACPEKNFCDGQKAVPNCTDVFCRQTAFAEPTEAGCCCIDNCSGVICKNGYTAKADDNGCCCI